MIHKITSSHIRHLRDDAVRVVWRVEATDSNLRICESEQAGMANVIALNKRLARSHQYRRLRLFGRAYRYRTKQDSSHGSCPPISKC
jgi:hypothetical protein